MYQRIRLSGLVLEGEPLGLPPEFAGLADWVLADFSAAMKPPPVGYEGAGLWPVRLVSPADLDHAAETTTDEVVSRAPDPATRTVSAVLGKRALTPEELYERQPVRRVYPADLWRRCTDAEADLIAAQVATMPNREQQIFNRAAFYDYADPDFATLQALMISAFGADRAAEILAPSAL